MIGVVKDRGELATIVSKASNKNVSSMVTTVNDRSDIPSDPEARADPGGQV